MLPSRPLRVHLLIDALGWGGAEMLLGDLAAGAQQAQLELSVDYLFSRDGDPAARRLADRGITPRHFPISGLLNPADHRRMGHRLRHLAPDVVHTHLAYSDLIGGLSARRVGVPALSTIHVMQWEDGLREATKLRLTAAVRRSCMSSVITVSDAAREAYLARGWSPPGQVVTVHNGIQARPPLTSGAELRAQLGLGPEHLVATMLSVLRPGKGHEAAIAAVAQLGRHLPQLRLLIAGEGPSREALGSLAAEAPGVQLIGHLEDVGGLLAASDVLLHPSHVDAFPTALLEAMAAGTPVLATRVGGIPEILRGGCGGVLIEAPPDPAELARTLAGLLENQDLRHDLGVSGRARYEQEFTASRWAQRLRKVYESALAGKTPRVPSRESGA